MNGKVVAILIISMFSLASWSPSALSDTAEADTASTVDLATIDMAESETSESIVEYVSGTCCSGIGCVPPSVWCAACIEKCGGSSYCEVTKWYCFCWCMMEFEGTLRAEEVDTHVVGLVDSA